MAFKCVVVTPEQQVFSQSVTGAILPAHDGEIGILTDRAPLLTKLGMGRLVLHMAGGGEFELFIAGGIAQMRENELTILTDEAVAPSAIDPETTRAELAEAASMRITDDASYQTRQARLRRAQLKLEMAS
jgi:F-type H+-transporting ATPase subunit epsilon